MSFLYLYYVTFVINRSHSKEIIDKNGKRYEHFIGEVVSYDEDTFFLLKSNLLVSFIIRTYYFYVFPFSVDNEEKLRRK